MGRSGNERHVFPPLHPWPIWPTTVQYFRQWPVPDVPGSNPSLQHFSACPCRHPVDILPVVISPLLSPGMIIGKATTVPSLRGASKEERRMLPRPCFSNNTLLGQAKIGACNHICNMSSASSPCMHRKPTVQGSPHCRAGGTGGSDINRESVQPTVIWPY